MGKLTNHSLSQSTTSSEAARSECSEMTEEMVKLLPLALTEDQSSEEIQRIKVKVRLLLEEKQKGATNL
jgi:hypothetical protein